MLGQGPRLSLVALIFTVATLAACQPASGQATAEEIALGASVEQARGHLAAALANARVGQWELAAIHAAHPQEAMQTVSASLTKHDAKADAELRRRVVEVALVAQAKDLERLVVAVTELDARFAMVAPTVMGERRATEVSYRASILATLADTIADEYAEAFETGRPTNVAEYQDAYVFLQRGLVIWADIQPALAASHADEEQQVAKALDGLRSALPTLDPPNAPTPKERVAVLADKVHEELSEAVGARVGVHQAGTAAFKMAGAHLDEASAALDRGDPAAAAAEVKQFRGGWFDIEGEVKARSSSSYVAIETDTAAALSKLDQRPADIAGAREAIDRIRGQLAPFAGSSASYGAFDAAVILLREGFEALLVVAALLAFLVQSGNADKRGWIWLGGLAGVAASVAVAVLVNVAFAASEATGASREILEGASGLFAAVMLVYVSYWMHSKSSLTSWQRYIREKSTSALARNSLLSLALVSFFAVFREGAETVLFYLGIAPSIALGDLLVGLAVGVAGLAALGVLVLVVGVRIPIRPFFLVASVLIYYLGFKFIGSGIHALQIAGVVPATPTALPGIDLIGVYPTWETTAVQVALLAAALGFIVFERARAARRTESVPAG